MKDSGLSSQEIDNFNVLPFWKTNESLLKVLQRSETPAKSRLTFKEISNNAPCTLR